MILNCCKYKKLARGALVSVVTKNPLQSLLQHLIFSKKTTATKSKTTTYGEIFAKFFRENIFIFLKIFALFSLFCAFLHKKMRRVWKVFGQILNKGHLSLVFSCNFEKNARTKYRQNNKHNLRNHNHYILNCPAWAHLKFAL